MTTREITVYPPNEILYASCETCRMVRWTTENLAPGGGVKRSLHCGCCTHPHDLPPGAHEIAEGGSRP